MLNLYGPTEATIVATYAWCKSSQSKVSIGRPLPNCSCYIVDKYMEPVPIGVTGELYVGGLGVARGYINNRELTTARFVSNHFSGGMLYRTGDMARWLPSGEIECVGRADDQVKLRGLRIELGEIEAVIAEYSSVRRAAAVVREVSGKQVLVAYVSPGNVDTKGLEIYISAKLPSYMVPQAVFCMEDLPLSSSDKVDKKSLPAFELTTPDIQHPTSKLEEQLLEIWAEVLNLDTVSTDLNFFQCWRRFAPCYSVALEDTLPHWHKSSPQNPFQIQHNTAPRRIPQCSFA